MWMNLLLLNCMLKNVKMLKLILCLLCLHLNCTWWITLSMSKKEISSVCCMPRMTSWSWLRLETRHCLPGSWFVATQQIISVMPLFHCPCGSPPAGNSPAVRAQHQPFQSSHLLRTSSWSRLITSFSLFIGGNCGNFSHSNCLILWGSCYN